jgi:uncharacterized protein (DUF697 family)
MAILLVIALIFAVLAGIAALVPEPYSRFATLLLAIAVGLVIINELL